MDLYSSALSGEDQGDQRRIGDGRDTGQSCPTGGPSGGVGSEEMSARNGYGRLEGGRGCAVPVQDSHKCRKAELLRVEAADQAMEVTRVPEPVASTATRVKRQRVHKLALGGKRRRDGAAFDAGRLPCHKSFRRGYERRACS